MILTGRHNHSIGHYGHSHAYNHFATYENVPTLPVLAVWVPPRVSRERERRALRKSLASDDRVFDGMARQAGITGFTAQVLPTNRRMLRARDEMDRRYFRLVSRFDHTDSVISGDAWESASRERMFSAFAQVVVPYGNLAEARLVPGVRAVPDAPWVSAMLIRTSCGAVHAFRAGLRSVSVSFRCM